MLGWTIGGWLAISGCSIWWLAWMVVAAAWPDQWFIAVSGAVIGFVMGAVVLAMAHEVAQS